MLKIKVINTNYFTSIKMLKRIIYAVLEGADIGVLWFLGL